MKSLFDGANTNTAYVKNKMEINYSYYDYEMVIVSGLFSIKFNSKIHKMPNAFQRFMHKVFFGFKYEKLK